MTDKIRFAVRVSWYRLLDRLDDVRIRETEAPLLAKPAIDDLRGRGFLDIGRCSCLFSLVAWRLGARIQSFGYDRNPSLWTSLLRRRKKPRFSPTATNTSGGGDAESIWNGRCTTA